MIWNECTSGQKAASVAIVALLVIATVAFGAQCLIDSSEGTLDGEWILDRCFYPDGQQDPGNGTGSAVADVMNIEIRDGVAVGDYGGRPFQGPAASCMMYVGTSDGLEAIGFLDSSGCMHLGITLLSDGEPFSAFCIYLKQGAGRGALDSQPNIAGTWGFPQAHGNDSDPVTSVEIDSLSGPMFIGTIVSDGDAVRMSGFLTMKDIWTMSVGMAIDSNGDRWGVLAEGGSIHLLGLGDDGASSVSLLREIDGIRQTVDGRISGGEWSSADGRVLSISDPKDDLVTVSIDGSECRGYLVYDRPFAIRAVIDGEDSMLIQSGDVIYVAGIGPGGSSMCFQKVAP